MLGVSILRPALHAYTQQFRRDLRRLELWHGTLQSPVGTRPIQSPLFGDRQQDEQTDPSLDRERVSVDDVFFEPKNTRYAWPGIRFDTLYPEVSPESSSLLFDRRNTEGSATCQRVLSVPLAWSCNLGCDPSWRLRLRFTARWSRPQRSTHEIHWLAGAAPHPELHRQEYGWVAECQGHCPATSLPRCG